VSRLAVLTMACVAGAMALAGCGPTVLSEPIQIVPAMANDPLAQRIKTDPIAAIDAGLAWYDQHVRDYTCTLYKRERMDPKAADFLPEQKVLCRFKEDPYSVFTHVVVNARGADKALYVEGKWNGHMLVRTSGLIGLTLEAEPRGKLARQNTLRFIDQFGFKRSLQNIRRSLSTALAEGLLTLKVLGVGEIGGRDVIVIESRIREPAPTGRFDFPHLQVYLDREWLIPLGVDVWDAQDIARGQYRLTDIGFNVGLTDADFAPKAVGL